MFPGELLLRITKHFPDTKKCSLQLSIFRGKSFRFGRVSIEAHELGVLKAEEEIPEDTLLPLLSQINVDSIPYDLNINTCSPL